jgi:hypothetical protein
VVPDHYTRAIQLPPEPVSTATPWPSRSLSATTVDRDRSVTVASLVSHSLSGRSGAISLIA